MSQNSEPTTTLRSARIAADMTLQDMRDGMLAILPKRLIPALSTLSRMETGYTHKVDTIVLYAAARVLGCKLSDLSVEAAVELETIRDLVVSTSPCITAR